MKKVRFNKYQKAMMLSVPLAITTNPLTVEVFIDWYKWFFTGVATLTTAYIIVFMLVMMFKPQPVNIPPKSKKTSVKDSQYLV